MLSKVILKFSKHFLSKEIFFLIFGFNCLFVLFLKLKIYIRFIKKKKNNFDLPYHKERE